MSKLCEKQEFQLIGDYVAENLVLEHLLLDHCAGYIVTGHVIWAPDLGTENCCTQALNIHVCADECKLMQVHSECG